ncbi:MAG: prenyltransferase/squalene oxidase repeat-containing protein, partial [Pirellulaceae bacterium]
PPPPTTALARTGTAAGPSASAVVSDIPEVGSGSAVAQAELDHMMGGMANMPMTRQSGEAIAVAAAAPEGAGGLGTEYSPEVGINSRKAREESVNVQTATTRFVRTSVGGLPSVSTAAVVSREPFVKRSARLDGDQPGSGRGASSPQTNAAIEAGLAFLARYQRPDGRWSLQGFDDATNAVSEDERRFMLVSDTGATALAILAFQGWGKNHREGEYRDVLHRGINHLLAQQKASGDLFVPADDRSNQSVWLYSHALATLALCEAYGMTGDPDLKEPAQRAIDFIVATQNRDLGGWRYSPEYDASGAIIGGVGTDTSVTGWMVAALYSARGAELAVPSETFARIEKWMNSAQGPGGESHLYRYNPYAPDTVQQRHGRVPSKTMTAVGLLSRSLLGWKPDHPALGRGAEFLEANRPSIGTAREPLRDTYYWYYATLALVYLKERDPARYEPVWQEWEAALHPILRNSQEKQGPWSGSWNPRGPVPDRWGLHAGRLYVTTMNLLSLEANYRYLPFHAAVQGQARETQATSAP